MCEDQQWIVRKACIEVLVDILNVCEDIVIWS